MVENCWKKEKKEKKKKKKKKKKMKEKKEHENVKGKKRRKKRAPIVIGVEVQVSLYVLLFSRQETATQKK